MTDSSATASALGYYYQSRLALLLLLRSDPGSEVTLEKFDDVAFEESGKPTQLIQSKHHITNTGSLSNASVDLWKTLRNWSAAVVNGSASPGDTVFLLITTGSAPEGSAADMLRFLLRNPEAAHETLIQVANESKSKENTEAYEAFKSLGEERQRKLLQNVYVFDGSPNITDCREDILKELRFATQPKFAEGLFERLEGWWFGEVVKHLSGSSATPISHSDLQAEIGDLQQQFFDDNLPIDFFDAVVPEEGNWDSEQRIFIRQLRLIALSNPRIKQAVSDYYRAYEQRSKWVREDLLLGGELDRYEKRLVEEWERLFEIMKEDLGDAVDNPTMQQSGRNLYNTIQMTFDIPIRPKCTQPYVMRGSYQILADNQRVGWHAEFLERLQRLMAVAGGGQS